MFQLHLEEKKSSLNKEIVFDVIVVGAGAAGLTAGIYLARDGWKTLILEKESPGGLAASTQRVENYPGFPEGIEGSTLMTRFESQAERFGVDLVDFEKVERISKNKQNIFEIHTQQGTYKAHTVLLATGSVPKHLGITGENEFFGKGVSYCATCDGPLYRDQEVAVVGFGDSALQEGETLLRYASKVTYIYYKPLSASHAQKILKDRVMANEKTEALFSHLVQGIKGEDQVNSLLLKDLQSGQIKEIDVDAVFIYIGYQPYTEFIRGFIDLDENGYINTDKGMKTSMPGVFAAGDVRSGNLAQVAVAVGDGARAAVAIREYLQEQVD